MTDERFSEVWTMVVPSETSREVAEAHQDAWTFDEHAGEVHEDLESKLTAEKMTNRRLARV